MPCKEQKPKYSENGLPPFQNGSFGSMSVSSKNFTWIKLGRVANVHVFFIGRY